MIIRALDPNGDWTFGAGLNNYKTNQNAVAQDMQTRLQSFLGDCFWDMGAGIDWFNLLGAKNQLALNLAINSVILNTANVTGINQVSTTVNTVTRVITITYDVETTFSQLTGQFVYDLSNLAAA